MKEGHRGSSLSNREKLRPNDAFEYINSVSWLIHYSPSTNCVYVDTKNYHPGEMELTINDVENLLLFMIEQEQNKPKDK